MSSETWEGIWIGALLSIPISIGATLATPAIQRRIEDWNNSSNQKRMLRLSAKYHRVLYYSLHTDFLMGNLVIAATTALCFLLAILMLLGPLSISHPDPLHQNDNIWWFASFCLGFVPGIWLSWMVFRPLLEFIKLFEHVTLFDVYVETIPVEIRKRRVEAMIARSARNELASLSYSEFRRRIEERGEDDHLVEMSPIT